MSRRLGDAMGRIAVATLALVALVLFGPVVSAATCVVGLAVHAECRDALRRRAAVRSRGSARGAIRLVCVELAAGSRPEQALVAGADLVADSPVGRALRRAATACTADGDVQGALAGPTELHAVEIAWQVAAGAGAPLSDVLSRVAADADARDGQAGRVQAALAGPRASAALLAVLPALGLALGVAMGAAPVSFLMRSATGHLCLLAGALLESAGLGWTRRLTARAEGS